MNTNALKGKGGGAGLKQNKFVSTEQLIHNANIKILVNCNEWNVIECWIQKKIVKDIFGQLEKLNIDWILGDIMEFSESVFWDVIIVSQFYKECPHS